MAEIEEIANIAAKKESQTELNRARVSPSLSLEAKIFMMSRLGIPADRIAARLKVNRLTALKYSDNSRLVQSIKRSLNKGHACYKVAEEHACPACPACPVAPEDGTGVAPADGTGVGPEDRIGGCPEPLVWSIAFEGKSDQERFKSLGWGLRTWDLWNWNECLPREIHVNDSLPG